VALARKHRIVNDKDFDHTFRFGRVVSGRNTVLKILPNNIGKTRFGVAISAKKFPLAVTRNKIKRAMFSEAASVSADFKTGCDIVMVAQADYDKNTGELGAIIAKAINRIKQNH